MRLVVKLMRWMLRLAVQSGRGLLSSRQVQGRPGWATRALHQIQSAPAGGSAVQCSAVQSPRSPLTACSPFSTILALFG